VCERESAAPAQGQSINLSRLQLEQEAWVQKRRYPSLLPGFWVEGNFAKGSLVVSFSPPKHNWNSDQTIYAALRDGGTFRWVITQRRGCDSHPATTEPLDFYCTA
jgi:hypothetical protein